MPTYSRKTRVFNQTPTSKHKNSKTKKSNNKKNNHKNSDHRKNQNQNLNQNIRKNNTSFGSGPPENNISNPSNGYIYVDSNTISTYIFITKLGWVDLTSWQPDVGEGAPSDENPPDPFSGDQYLDILTGDFYVYSDGFGWVLNNGIEGPTGPPGPSFKFQIITTQGVDGPINSGPIEVNSGQTIQLWLNDRNHLMADVI